MNGGLEVKDRLSTSSFAIRETSKIRPSYAMIDTRTFRGFLEVDGDDSELPGPRTIEERCGIIPGDVSISHFNDLDFFSYYGEKETEGDHSEKHVRAPSF